MCVREEADFKQEGVIDAISPAIALEIHPRFSLGFALNFYQDNMFRSGRIGSRTRVGFSGTAQKGFNATLGLLWVVSGFLTLGAAVDLPWDADTEQTRTIATRATTYNRDRSRVLDTFESTETEKKDVALEFPLFVTLGTFFRWNPNLYTAVDVGFAKV